MAQIIYGDEAGFTGNNLLDQDQPFFAYATVAAEPEHAANIVSKTIRDFRIDGGELKGQRLISSNRGRKAIASVLSEFSDHVMVQAYHKRYTLASKFFEYVFEPVLAKQSSIFYRCGFHRFISAFIYIEAMTDGKRATQVLAHFQDLMRERDPKRVDSMFPAAGLFADCSDVLRDMETFAICHRDVIAADVASHSGAEPLYRWMLDVSLGALWNLLQLWGERFDELVVLCDESNPLYEARAQFDIMIGRTDKNYIKIDDRLQPLIFNLAGPIGFGSSRDNPGIQVADLFATTAVQSLRNPGSSELASLKELIVPSIHNAILPDTEALDLETAQAFANRLVLFELVERSLKKENLFIRMPEFIDAALQKHAEYLRDPARTQLMD